MRSSDTEAIAILTQIRAGVVSNNYDRLLNNYLTRGNSSRNREVVTILTKMRNTSPDVLGYDLLIGNYFRRGDNFGNRLISQLLTQIRDSMLTPPVPVIPTMTNAQKLSLPANTAVGTRVKVSDGFVVSGAEANLTSAANGFYYTSGTENGKTRYLHYPNVGGTRVYYNVDDGAWAIFDETSSIFLEASAGNEDYPWQSDLADSATITLTHPAVQQLQSPSSSQGGVFVSGGTQDGIWVPSNVFGDYTLNGKPVYQLLGDNGGSSQLVWENPGDLDPPFDVTGGWRMEDTNGTVLYISQSDVATPDLASNWKNASDDSPASITVTSVTQGELDAGVTVAGAGTSAQNGVFPGPYPYQKIGATNGQVIDADFTGGEPTWDSHDNSNAYYGGTRVSVPWNASWSIIEGTPPAPTVTRNNVAAEANWQVVP